MAPKKAVEKSVEEKYIKMEPREHILARPGMYISSIDIDIYNTWVLNDDGDRLERREIAVVPGLFKIYDEVLVNAIDHVTRMKQSKEVDENAQQVKNIKISIDIKTGEISVFNDGEGIDVVIHPEHKIYVPELIFGHLLTSTNYDDTVEKLIGGQNGHGSKLTNIFSKSFKVETVDAKNKKSYEQEWTNNMSEKSKPIIRSAATKKPYTRITFTPDYERFKLKKGLTKDMYALLAKRAYDVCALTDADVNVFFNDEKLEYKTFEKYVDLYIGPKSDKDRVYEKVNDRWEVIATMSEDIGFDQVSFVNGIWTIRGGKHVDYIANQIAGGLADMINSKKKNKEADIKPLHIKNHLMIFIKCTISNPTFDSQTKDLLTTPMSKFGSKCDLPQKFFDKLYKTEIVDKALNLADASAMKAMKKTDGKKSTKIHGMVKLDDAKMAGTAKSAQCTLILTEGDSAKSTALAGLSEVGRDFYGIFPLRGKLLNVKDVTVKKILENEEIQAIKKIMGLESGKVYTSLGDLRYGRIMLMCDSDVDGSHIRGLLMNLFQTLWPSLIAKGLVTSLLTPIIKVWNTKTTLKFYNYCDYEKWAKEQGAQVKNWKVKYYKGLGTSNEQEAVSYFKDMHLAEYKHTGKPCDDALDMAFNKKRADDRKNWLSTYIPDACINYDKNLTPVNYKDFINRELIHFSVYDVKRSVPSMVDGLKPSQRKILYCCFKRNLVSETKVAQLSGYVSEHSAYHHGETSLQGAIICMAQDFVGANNMNLLKPNGQFGCLDPETDILMWDSTTKKAKDIDIGDQLVGDDGRVRNVLRTTSGSDEMYEINMGPDGSYIVNSQHILTLTYSGNSDFGAAFRNKCVFDIKVCDYLELPTEVQNDMHCIKNSACINWGYQPVPIDPYVMGLWLGDDNVIDLASEDTTDIEMLDILKANGWLAIKDIPSAYIHNDKITRLQLLAGLIDATATLKYHPDFGLAYYEFLKSSNLDSQLIEGIAILAKSLGFMASVDIFGILIVGNGLHEIPSRFPQKQVDHMLKPFIKNIYDINFTVKPLGVGKFCGWSVDKNERFLLGDFTITHNSRVMGQRRVSTKVHFHRVESFDDASVSQGR